MGSRNMWENATAPDLTRESLERGMAELFAFRRPRPPYPDEAHVEVEGDGYRVTFYGGGRFVQTYQRHADRLPAFVPLEGRLALRLMRQVGGGLTVQQRMLCRVVAEAIQPGDQNSPK
jgi:hypothetical protein